MTIISKSKSYKMSETTKQGLFLAALAVAVMLPDMASATGAATFGTTNSGTFQGALCNALSYITGGVGASIATLAIIALGIGATLGKIAWTTVIICCCGIAAIFGASEIVNTISAGGGTSAAVECGAGV